MTRFAPSSRRLALALLAALAAGAAVAADPFPNRPVTLIYPFAPGGIGDASARILADGLKKHLNTSVVVETKPGAGGAIGANFVKQAKPDGYTLLVGGASALVYTPLLEPATTYEPLKDFKVIGFVDNYELVMVTGKPTGYTSVKAVLDAAKAPNGPKVYGATGNGTSPNLAAQWLTKIANVKMEPANYRGTSAALPDVLAGRVPFLFMSPQSAGPHLKSGAALGLAFSGRARDKDMPDVPTFAEAGYPEFHKLDWSQWNGLFAPAGVPQEELRILNQALQKTLNDPEIQARYAKLGTAIYKPMSLDQVTEMFRTSFAQWQSVIKDLK